MKLKPLLLFILFAQTIFGQNNTYYGAYDGKLEGIYNGDTTKIVVKLELRKDSTFQYEINGLFSACTSQTFICSGKWFSDIGWLYFKSDTLPRENLEFMVQRMSFVLSYPVPFDSRTKNENDMIWKYGNGYDDALKITNDKSNCPKIFFRISYDCFEVWRNIAIQKTDCK